MGRQFAWKISLSAVHNISLLAHEVKHACINCINTMIILMGKKKNIILQPFVNSIQLSRFRLGYRELSLSFDCFVVQSKMGINR